MAFWSRVKAWFVGKKTYLAAGFLFALGVFAIADGDTSNDMLGMSLLILGFGLIGLRSHSERNAQFVAHEIADVKTLIQTKNFVAFSTDLLKDLQTFGIVGVSPDEGAKDAAVTTAEVGKATAVGAAASEDIPGSEVTDR